MKVACWTLVTLAALTGLSSVAPVSASALEAPSSPDVATDDPDVGARRFLWMNHHHHHPAKGSGKGSGGSETSKIKSSSTGKGGGGSTKTKSPGGKGGKGGASSSSSSSSAASCKDVNERCSHDGECCSETCRSIGGGGAQHWGKECVYPEMTPDPTSDPTSDPTTDDPTSDPTTSDPTSVPTRGPTSGPTSSPTSAPVDPCASEPCENDGTCTAENNGTEFTCECPVDYFNPTCGTFCNTTATNLYNNTHCGCNSVNCLDISADTGEDWKCEVGICTPCCDDFNDNETACGQSPVSDFCEWRPDCNTTFNPDGQCRYIGGTCNEGDGSIRYCRILSEFDDRRLFSLMEGDELHEHLSEYDAKKDMQSSLGVCDYPGSKYRGQGVTHGECFDPANQVLITPSSSSEQAKSNENDKQATTTKEFKPWTVPAREAGGILLASNPGIWSFENFIDEDEEKTLLELVDKYGNDLHMFGPCKHDQRHPVNAHPTKGKACFKISPQNVCDGPYDISACSAATDPDDAAFVSHLLSKFKDMWAANVDPYPYAKFQLSYGGTPPVDLHMDNEKSISFVLYLSDGGAKMIFPNAGVEVTPQRRAAHTWLNMYENGERNPMSDHAVQAHPAHAGERLVMLFEVPVTPQQILMAPHYRESLAAFA